jgi:hypothetical protein
MAESRPRKLLPWFGNYFRYRNVSFRKPTRLKVLLNYHLFLSGDYSERIEALSDGQVKEEVLSVLKSMYPHVDIPQPLDFWFPRWHTDPLLVFQPWLSQPLTASTGIEAHTPTGHPPSAANIMRICAPMWIAYSLRANTQARNISVSPRRVIFIPTNKVQVFSMVHTLVGWKQAKLSLNV